MRLLTLILTFAMSVPAFADEALLCAPNFSTGFDFEKVSNTWHPTNFNIVGEKHYLHRKNGRMVWSTTGAPSDVDLGCKEFDKNGFMTCGGVIDGVTINRKRLRYMSSLTAGYVTNEPDGEDTPKIEIGICSVQ